MGSWLFAFIMAAAIVTRRSCTEGVALRQGPTASLDNRALSMGFVGARRMISWALCVFAFAFTLVADFGSFLEGPSVWPGLMRSAIWSSWGVRSLVIVFC